MRLKNRPIAMPAAPPTAPRAPIAASGSVPQSTPKDEAPVDPSPLPPVLVHSAAHAGVVPRVSRGTTPPAMKARAAQARLSDERSPSGSPEALLREIQEENSRHPRQNRAADDLDTAVTHYHRVLSRKVAGRFSTLRRCFRLVDEDSNGVRARINAKP